MIRKTGVFAGPRRVRGAGKLRNETGTQLFGSEGRTGYIDTLNWVQRQRLVPQLNCFNCSASDLTSLVTSACRVDSFGVRPRESLHFSVSPSTLTRPTSLQLLRTLHSTPPSCYLERLDFIVLRSSPARSQNLVELLLPHLSEPLPTTARLTGTGSIHSSSVSPLRRHFQSVGFTIVSYAQLPS